jgi:PKD repeat protein
MKNFILLIAVFSVSFSYSQGDWCGFDHKMEKVFEENPGAENQIYERFERISSGQLLPQDRVGEIIIPVVVHVIHDNGEGNISYAQIEDAIRVLNEDFNKTNSDISSIRNTANAPFLNEAADIGISFALAKIDPSGNCTNGVERRNSSLGTYNGNDDLSKTYSGGGLDAWDRNKYFNIWVVNSIEYTGTLTNGVILGYAQFPMWGNANTYGVIIRNDRFGEIGTGSTDRTISHEVGHCLGLYHTFQGGCGASWESCNGQGDGICDTPPVDEAHWSCGSTQNNCTQVQTGDFYGFDVYDQFENFMSYSPCQYMFSEGQKDAVLSNLSDLNHLANLSAESNQIATGVGLPAVLCKSDFSSTKTVICAGSTIDFSDISYSTVNGRAWSFDGGNPSTSTDSTMTITYESEGIYPVSLSVTDGLSTLTETKTNYITVLPNPGVELPYIEGFEEIDFPDNYNFFVENEDGGNSWDLTSTAASTGNKSLKLLNYNVNGGSEDAIVSGSINLGDLDDSEEMLMTFKYAYNKRYEDNTESLKIYVSKDCGNTWVIRKNIQYSNLGEVTNQFSYTPDSEQEWIQATISNISSTYFVPNFRYKIVFKGDGGNNIFIDDINLYPLSWLSNDEVVVNNSVSIYPNPTSNNSTLEFFSTIEENGLVEIYDLVGKKVKSIYNGPIKKGLNQFELEVMDIPTGVYFVKIKTSSGVLTKKLIKE